MKKSISKLSPFEVKNTLLNIASTDHQRHLLNAGRGNPNFLAMEPRYAFLRLGEFALLEAQRSYAYLHAELGGVPEKEGIVGRFDGFVAPRLNLPGMNLLNSALSYVDDHIGVERADFLFEMVEAYLGCNYPAPPRMLSICEAICKNYLGKELCGSASHQNFDLFATEGGTAAMTYFFASLKHNGLITKGDKVAIVTPIFSPYLEIPPIPEFGLESVYIRAKEEKNWQVSESEWQKLADKNIKLLCLVNPSNPPSVKLNEDSLLSLQKTVNEKRPDLMIVTDDVYATFSDDFRSVFSYCPMNTLAVYSFSKYFGATGWRIGLMALREDNVFDKLIAKLSPSLKKQLNKRYESLTPNVDKLKFIDRLVADSRSVVLNHTAGISTPSQVQLTLFALASLLDETDHYRRATKGLIQRRYDLLYSAIGYTPPSDINRVDYYTLIDLEQIAKVCYDEKFSQWILDNVNGIDFLMKLAKETSVVLLPGKGFESEHPSVRVSLANLKEHDYKAIGYAVKKILAEYYQKL